jgi:hypothetical protein
MSEEEANIVIQNDNNMQSPKKSEHIKKFKSAYILYSTEKRRELKQLHPMMGNPELTKMIAKEWKSIPAEEKEKYYEMEKEEKNKFAKMKQDSSMRYTYNKGDRMKKPVRFRTAYMFYIMEHKNFLNSKDKYINIELIKRLSQKWGKMTDEEKQPYFEKAKNDRKRYEEDWENYIKSYFKVKPKKNHQKEKTERMIYDLLKACNRDDGFHSHLKNVWEKMAKKGSFFRSAIQGKGKERRRVFLKKMVFQIEKISKNKKNVPQRRRNIKIEDDEKFEEEAENIIYPHDLIPKEEEEYENDEYIEQTEEDFMFQDSNFLPADGENDDNMEEDSDMAEPPEMSKAHMLEYMKKTINKNNK